MAARKVRWGILSTARIGLQRVIPAMSECSNAEVIAIASRTRAAAEEAATSLGIPRAYGSYRELLEDPDVEVIYNPLPNHLHVPLSIEALEAGKHVLCEKPLAMNADQAFRLLRVARTRPHLKVMEAFMYRLHPQWARVRDLIDSGVVGDVRTVHSHFSFFNDDPENIRNQAEIGGGSLMDVGCYTVSVARFVFGSEPKRVVAAVDFDPRFGTDRLVSGTLCFNGGTATFTCGTQMHHRQQVLVTGSSGMIDVVKPFTPSADERCRIILTRADEAEEVLIEPANQYTLQAELFSQAVLDDLPVPTPLEDGIANMRVLDAIVQSARSKGWVEVGRSAERTER
jgi:predicted dehydrogenase